MELRTTGKNSTKNETRDNRRYNFSAAISVVLSALSGLVNHREAQKQGVLCYSFGHCFVVVVVCCYSFRYFTPTLAESSFYTFVVQISIFSTCSIITISYKHRLRKTDCNYCTCIKNATITSLKQAIIYQ